MNRRIAKAANEYKSTFGSKEGTTNGAFYASDYYEVKEVVERISRGYADTLWNTMTVCLQAGFMIGYRKGKRDAYNYKRSRQA